MPVCRDWCVEAQVISKREADALSIALGNYLDEPGNWDNGFYQASFFSEGIRDDEIIESAIKEFSLQHPTLTISVYVKQDPDDCPDKMKFRNGTVRYYTGIVKYYEYDPQTGQTSEIPDKE